MKQPRKPALCSDGILERQLPGNNEGNAGQKGGCVTNQALDLWAGWMAEFRGPSNAQCHLSLHEACSTKHEVEEMGVLGLLLTCRVKMRR